MKHFLILTGIILTIPFSMSGMSPDDREHARQSWLARERALNIKAEAPMKASAAEPVVTAPREPAPPVIVRETTHKGDCPVEIAAAQNCPICFEPENEHEFYTLSCGHNVCVNCLRRVIDTAIGEKTIAQLRCPVQDCNHPLDRDDIRDITHNPEKLIAIGDIETQEWIAQQPNAKHCLTPNCPYMFLSDESCPQPVECKGCGHKYCSSCLLPHAVTMTCREAQAGRIVDRESDEWKRANTKPCPRCKTRIQKDGGCLFVMCTNCRLGFCYNCGGTHHVFACANPPMHIDDQIAGPAEAHPYDVGQDEFLAAERAHRLQEAREAAEAARLAAARRAPREDQQAYADALRPFEPGPVQALNYGLYYPGLRVPRPQPRQARPRRILEPAIGIAVVPPVIIEPLVAPNIVPVHPEVAAEVRAIPLVQPPVVAAEVLRPIEPLAAPVVQDLRLIQATKAFNVDAALALIADGIDLNAVDDRGNTALIYATSCHSMKRPPAIALAIIAAGADLNKHCELGVTALMHAVRSYQKYVVNALIAAGANVNIRDHNGKTALKYACDSYYLDAMREILLSLIAAGADLNAHYDGGRTVLISALYSMNKEALIPALINAKVDLNAIDDNGSTALNHAINNGLHEIAQLLRAAGAR